MLERLRIIAGVTLSIITTSCTPTTALLAEEVGVEVVEEIVEYEKRKIRKETTRYEEPDNSKLAAKKSFRKR